jgi:multimeric flavodoxin WrbA
LKDNVRIKILGIAGSPRRNGNTEFLLTKALEAAKAVDPGNIETEFYSIAGKKYLPCISCFTCAKTGYCILGEKDDFFELRDKWIDADAIIIAVPVYHMGIPGQLKCFIDRLGNSVDQGYPAPLKHLKVYGVITQGIHIFSGQEHAATDLINHALIMGNIVVSGDAPESYIGSCGWTENKVEKDALKKLYNRKRLDAIFTVKASSNLGKRVAELALIIKLGALQYIDHLEKDPAYSLFVKRIKKR